MFIYFFQCLVRGRLEALPPGGGWGQAARPVPGLEPGSQQSVEPGPGPAQQHDPPGGDQVSAPGVAVVRDVVQRSGENSRQNNRSCTSNLTTISCFSFFLFSFFFKLYFHQVKRECKG